MRVRIIDTTQLKLAFMTALMWTSAGYGETDCDKISVRCPPTDLTVLFERDLFVGQDSSPLGACENAIAELQVGGPGVAAEFHFNCATKEGTKRLTCASAGHSSMAGVDDECPQVILLDTPVYWPVPDIDFSDDKAVQNATADCQRLLLAAANRECFSESLKAREINCCRTPIAFVPPTVTPYVSPPSPSVMPNPSGFPISPPPAR